MQSRSIRNNNNVDDDGGAENSKLNDMYDYDDDDDCLVDTKTPYILRLVEQKSGSKETSRNLFTSKLRQSSGQKK